MKWRINFLTSAVMIFSLVNVHNAQSNNFKTVKVNDYLTINEIEKDVYRVSNRFPWQANSLLVRVGDKDFVLADTPIDNTGSQALVEWMRKEFGDIKLTVINCHFHIDCLGGNHYMISQGFPVYASDMTLQLFEENKGNMIDRMLQGITDSVIFRAIKNLQPTAPDHIFKAEEGLTLHIGKEDIDIYYPGPAHTKDNIVVFFPEKGILYGGCMVKAFEQKNLGNQSDADLAAWPVSAQELLDKYPDARIVMPGHGMWGDLSMINHTLELLYKR